MDTKEEQAFFSQINEDIKLIQKEFLPIDPKLNKKEYYGLMETRHTVVVFSMVI